MTVIVIGAGVVGCAIAYELASRGASVRVLDMRRVGQGATRASAGVLCPHIEGHASDLLTLGVRSLAMYDAFVARVRSATPLPIEYERNGTLEVATADDDAAALRALAGQHRAAGVEHHLLDSREARELEPGLSGQVTAALLVPVHGYVGVSGFTAALAAAAIARGASIEEGVTVRRVTTELDRVVVDTAEGTFHAHSVIVAAGSWSGHIGVGTSPPAPVKPVRGQLLHLAPPRATPVPLAPFASRVIWGRGCYLVPWEDGSILVGATVEDVGFDESATVAGVKDLLGAACEILPALWRARFQEVRVGLRPASADEMPIIGRSSTMPRVYYATGHYRNGVLLAPLTAAMVADLVLEGRDAPELALTRPDRFGL